MGTLIDSLREKVRVIPERVDAINLKDSGWNLTAGGEDWPCDRVVVACGANHAAPLLGPLDEELGVLLGAIPYTGSSIWTFGYLRQDVAHPLDAFGFLVPEAERRSIMACTWVGTKWAGRVPDDKAVFRCFSTDPEVSGDVVETELRQLMGIRSDPLFAINSRWPDSMPQYTVGHTARVQEIEERIQAFDGLFLAGNAWHGIGIPDCVRTARLAAEACLASLSPAV